MSKTAETISNFVDANEDKIEKRHLKTFNVKLKKVFSRFDFSKKKDIPLKRLEKKTDRQTDRQKERKKERKKGERVRLLQERVCVLR